MRNTCPICREWMAGTSSSRLATIIIRNIDHRCENEVYGCENTSQLDAIVEHNKSCPYRKIVCINRDCLPAYSRSGRVQLVSVGQIVEHYVEKHYNNSQMMEMGTPFQISAEDLEYMSAV